MKYRKRKKYTLPAIPLLTTLLLASCAPNDQVTGNETLKIEETATVESTSSDSQEFPAEIAASDHKETASTGKELVSNHKESAYSDEELVSNHKESASNHKESDSDNKESASDDEETDSSDETTVSDVVSLGNPMKPVDSEKDFSALGLSLSLPENETWCSGRSYFIIDGRVAHIAFYDEITKSDAIARAGNETDGDPSGIYYNFDEKKEETWTAFMADGTQVDITVSVTVDNSDVHGVLAAWTYEGVRYSLWEDNARDQTSEVGKLAIEIAKKADFPKP